MTVRGKCRHCAASVRQAANDYWSAEGWPMPDAFECAAAPPIPCVPCAGAGEIQLAHRDEHGQPIWRPCVPCRGTGLVRGPHWPWRHPPTQIGA